MLLVMVIPHEWGHMIVAKMCGVKVNEFSVGMGPLLFKKQKGETQYSIRLLPLGGYCAMEGESEASNDPRSYSSKSNFQKFLILIAGVTMNILIAILIMIVSIEITGMASTTLASVLEGSPAEAAGLQAGDKLIEIDGTKIREWSDITTVISSYHEGDRMEIVYRRDGHNKTIFLMPEYNKEEKRYMIGITPEATHNPLVCIPAGVRSTWELNKMMIGGFYSLVKGGISKDDVAGPVGLVKVVDTTISYGFTSYLLLLAMVSLNLAFFNVLPIPGLDGGKILFIILKILSGGRITDDMELKATVAGMILLITLVLIITYNDITNLFK
jgi:regulator of sigma E protease